MIWQDLTRGGGGGGVLPYVCILAMCRARDPHFQPWISVGSGAYHFHKLPKKSVPEHHHLIFFAEFCRSGDHHFQNFFNFNPFIASHGRLSGLVAGQSASQTRPGSSGDSHFHAQNGSSSFRSPAFQAQNGSSSFRSPAFSRSTGSSFRSPGPFFTLRGTYLPKFGARGEYPPPPRDLTSLRWNQNTRRNPQGSCRESTCC